VFIECLPCARNCFSADGDFHPGLHKAKLLKEEMLEKEPKARIFLSKDLVTLEDIFPLG
jgi:hypothetical protein